MIRGAHTAMSAMRAQLARQEVLARNLENLSTAGYKQERGALDGFSSTLGRVERGMARTRLEQAAATTTIGSLPMATAIDRVSVDFRSGRMEETGRQSDVALEGDGFLEVRTPEGYFYFRGGPLQLDADGRLVTSEGYPVLGDDGEEILLPSGSFSIAADGTITSDGQPVAALSVVEFDAGTQLAKVGAQFYTPDDPATAQPMVAATTEVKQGFLESSNVDAMSTMTELVSLVRAYQASQRMLQAQDDLLGKAVNEVGRI